MVDFELFNIQYSIFNIQYSIMLDSFKHLVRKKTKEETQLQTYKNILEKTPNNVNIRLKLGDLYTKTGKKEAAIKEYTTAAIQYAGDGYLVKAIAVNKIIVRLDPARKEALDRLSELYFQRGITADPLVQDYRKSHQEAQAPEELKTSQEEIEIPTIETQEHEISVDFEVEVIPPEEQDEGEDISGYLKQAPLLSDLSDETQRWLINHCQVHTYAAQEHVIERENSQESLFIVLNGKAQVFTKDKENQDTLLENLESGGFFGGTSLFAPMRQNQDETLENHVLVLAETSCTVLEIPKSTLAALIKKEQAISETLLMEYYKRRASDIALARVPLFSYLDPVERRKIAEQLTPVHVRKGTTIITEGEFGDSMFVIKSGRIGVYTTLMQEDGVNVIKTDQERLHLATLQEGDFFGEQALITKEPRSATTIALTDVRLLKFTKQDLALVVKSYPRVGTLLKKYHQQRIANTLESLKSIW